MRHRNVNKILDRKAGPRKALVRGLVEALIIYEKIQTTNARAEVIRPIVEKLVTIGKANDLTARRRLLDYLYTNNGVKKVLEVLSPRYAQRAGGYLRINKIGPRQGDAAEMVLISFV